MLCTCILIFAIALFTLIIKAKDPYARYHLEIPRRTGDVDGLAVYPDGRRDCPIVICVGAKAPGTLATTELTALAELGFLAVSFRGHGAIAAEDIWQIQTEIKEKIPAAGHQYIWICSSDAAQVVLDALNTSHDDLPKVVVGLNQHWPEQLSVGSPRSAVKFIVVESEYDTTVSESERKSIAQRVAHNGSQLKYFYLPGVLRDFGDDRLLVLRSIAELTMSLLHREAPPVRGNPPFYKDIPLLIIGALLTAIISACWYRWYATPTRLLGMALGCIVTVTTVPMLARVGAIRTSTAGVMSDWSQRHLEEGTNVSNSDHPLPRDSLALASLVRFEFYPQIPESTFRDFVLSSEVERSIPPVRDWRRALWTSCYPRIRHEKNPSVAAKLLVRFLRERVSITDQNPVNADILSCWERGMASERTFYAIYTAALRSVGIAARLSSDGLTELYDGETWIRAPEPAVMRLDYAVGSTDVHS